MSEYIYALTNNVLQRLQLLQECLRKQLQIILRKLNRQLHNIEAVT